VSRRGINSRGDRDDEPRLDIPPARRLLLLGDSYTFGQGLTAVERIDHRIEHHAGGTVDAYNMGVMGYGTGHSLGRLSASSWWEGRAVYYLFYENDLRDDNASPDMYTVYSGFVVPRLGPDGEPYTPAQWDRLFDRARARDERGNSLTLTLTLPRLRALVQRAMDRNMRLSGYSSDTLHAETVSSSIAYTKALGALAHDRGASFTVVVLPARGEATADEYSDPVRAYLDGIEAAGIETIEVLDRLDAGDYFAHDPHFNPGGADKVAQAIWRHFDDGSAL
jgi:hypothetical protein